MALATCPRTRASTLSMRLLVDAKAGRVLYAEAGKDVVDLLLSFLTLPLATVVKLLSADAMPGCVANLYGSTAASSGWTRPTSAPPTPGPRCSRRPEVTMAASCSSCQRQWSPPLNFTGAATTTIPSAGHTCLR